MEQQVKDLVESFTILNDEIKSFVRQCSEEDWKKVCRGEGWSVGVVARHIAGTHYSIIGLVKAVVAGGPLPEMSMDAIDQINARHAQKHADCTREEVLDMLSNNGTSIADFISGLSDEDLSRSAHFPLSGGDVSPRGLIHMLLQGCSEHFSNIKTAIS
jgi:hypothetical protein